MSRNILVASIVLVLLVVLAYTLMSNNNNSTPSDNSKTITRNETITSAPADASPAAALKIEDIKVGTGKEVKSKDFVKIHYLGTLTNGQKFDSSYDRNQPFETQIGVGQVIKGWDLGVVGMKVGGKRKLTIPPDLGYGSRGAGNVIPPNATLIFELELLDVK